LEVAGLQLQALRQHLPAVVKVVILYFQPSLQPAAVVGKAVEIRLVEQVLRVAPVAEALVVVRDMRGILHLLAHLKVTTEATAIIPLLVTVEVAVVALLRWVLMEQVRVAAMAVQARPQVFLAVALPTQAVAAVEIGTALPALVARVAEALEGPYHRLQAELLVLPIPAAAVVVVVMLLLPAHILEAAQAAPVS
jgi:hypothetical protein